MSSRSLSNRIAALYGTRSLQGYARWKIRFDPIYGGVLEPLRDVQTPLIDLGCGIGLLAFYLREHGHGAPIIGIDFDERKIAVARHAATRYRGIDFVVADARDPLPEGHSVVLLDLLLYFDPASQRRILANAAAAVPPGGVVVMRQGLRDGSWRHRVQKLVDAIGRGIGWMKAEDLQYPTLDEITAHFDGFEREVRPLWGRTPYNNYLLVFRRPATARRPE